MESVLAVRFFQKASVPEAPGKRQPMPTTATVLTGSMLLM